MPNERNGLEFSGVCCQPHLAQRTDETCQQDNKAEFHSSHHAGAATVGDRDHHPSDTRALASAVMWVACSPANRTQKCVTPACA